MRRDAIVGAIDLDVGRGWLPSTVRSFADVVDAIDDLDTDDVDADDRYLLSGAPETSEAETERVVGLVDEDLAGRYTGPAGQDLVLVLRSIGAALDADEVLRREVS